MPLRGVYRSLFISVARWINSDRLFNFSRCVLFQCETEKCAGRIVIGEMASGRNENKVTLVGELSRKALAFSVDALLAADRKHGTTSTRKERSHPPRSRLHVELTSKELWSKFHRLGTEMIITKAGRRMFPTIKVNLQGMEPQISYIVFLDIVPKDNKRYRYIYHSSQWSVAGTADPPLSPAIFVHPDSPSLGRLWMSQGVIAFDKLKLTNNRKPIVRGQVSLHSMHKYQPRVHILPTVDITTPPITQAYEALKSGKCSTFTFPETVFTTVTAYQNQQITRLKIASNPFAKGFREASKKCDAGTQQRHAVAPATTAPILSAFLPVHMASCPMAQCQLSPCPLLQQLVRQPEPSHPPLDLRRRQQI